MPVKLRECGYAVTFLCISSNLKNQEGKIMRIQHWILGFAILLIPACGTDQSSSWDQSEESGNPPDTGAIDALHEEDNHASIDDEEVSNDYQPESGQSSQLQTDNASRPDTDIFYSEGYHEGASKPSNDPKTKICVRNKVNKKLHFKVAQNVGGTFGTTLSKGSSFCSSDLTAGSMSVARDKQGPRYCERAVKLEGSYALVEFNENSECEWEEN